MHMCPHVNSKQREHTHKHISFSLFHSQQYSQETCYNIQAKLRNASTYLKCICYICTKTLAYILKHTHMCWDVHKYNKIQNSIYFFLLTIFKKQFLNNAIKNHEKIVFHIITSFFITDETYSLFRLWKQYHIKYQTGLDIKQ